MLAAFLVFLLSTVIPNLRNTQSELLSTNYEQVQLSIVQQEVEDLSTKISRLHHDLEALGIAPAIIQTMVLHLIQNERFGEKRFGYFYIVDTNGVLIFHPIQKELVNQRLADVFSPDHTNMGHLFTQALSKTGHSFIRYQWQQPTTGKIESKIAFIKRIPDWNWIIAAGFYPSEIQQLTKPLAQLTNHAINDALWDFFRLSLPVLLAFVLFSGLITFSILKISITLDNQLRSLEQYKTLLDYSSIVTRTDSNGIITYVNNHFVQTTGFSPEEALGKKHNIERHPDTSLETFKDLWRTILVGKVWQGILKNRKASGESYLKQVTIVPIIDQRGKIVEYISSGQDISVLMDQQAKLERAFLTDQLSGLGNQYKLHADMGAHAIAGAALFAFENFATMAQVYGQEVCDDVLRRFSSALLDRLDAAWYQAYRYTDDTLAVLSSDPSPKRFRNSMRELLSFSPLLTVNKTSLRFGLNLGIALRSGESLTYAEIALEKARETREHVYDIDQENTELGPQNRPNLQIIKHLHEALEADRLYPVFQPILNLHSGAIEKYECLIRAKTAEGVELMPQEFLEIAKKTQRYQMITLRLLEKSVQYFRNKPFEFAVNLDLDDLTNRETINFLTGAVKEAGVANRMVVEIVETQELVNFERVTLILDALKSQGIKIAIDDFGSGYSNFNYLLRLNPHYVKIDGSIISQVEINLRAKELVKSLVDFARHSNISTIAEYVDSPALLDTVKSLGVDYAQGWLIGKAKLEI